MTSAVPVTPNSRIPNIADQLLVHAQQRPSKTAIIFGTERINYRQLNQMVDQRASVLVDMGVRSGDVLGIALKDTPEHLVMLYAVVRSGAVILPVDCRWLAVEKERVARHFGAKWVLVEPGETFVGGVCISADEAWFKQVAAAPPLTNRPDGDRGFCLSLSSGTTGRPKGPMLTHAQFMSRFFTHYADLGFGSRETYLNATPLYFGGGRAFSMSCLYVGATVVLFAPPHTPQSLASEIARTGVTITFLVPTLIRRLLQAAPEVTEPFSHLNTLIASGSPLTAEERILIRERICPSFIEYYSSTEGGGVTVLSTDDQLAFGASVGRPVFGVEVQVVDADNHPVAAGIVGPIRYRGPTVASGFFNDPDNSKDAFVGGWFYPGDLGELNSEGYLFLRGRVKDMIIRGGVNIYPLEIETVLLNHPRVAEAAVIGVPSREFDEEVCAFVRLRDQSGVADLMTYCKGQLAPYKVPKYVIAVNEFKLNSAGKILKAELVQLFSATAGQISAHEH